MRRAAGVVGLLLDGGRKPNVVLFRTGLLVDHGYRGEAERRALHEIDSYDPPLFDFVLKRTVRSPGTGRKFAPEIFSRRIP
jgi:hypothetical protein